MSVGKLFSELATNCKVVQPVGSHELVCRIGTRVGTALTINVVEEVRMYMSTWAGSQGGKESENTKTNIRIKHNTHTHTHTQNDYCNTK